MCYPEKDEHNSLSVIYPTTRCDTSMSQSMDDWWRLEKLKEVADAEKKISRFTNGRRKKRNMLTS